MTEYIEREVAVCIALGAAQLGNTAFSDRFEIAARIRKIPAADVLPRDEAIKMVCNEFYCKFGIKREEN